MGKLKDFWTLKIHLGRHGFEFHRNPMNRTSKILNIATGLMVIPVLITLWALIPFAIVAVACLVYKEPAK